jgi:hypothetical protein
MNRKPHILTAQNLAGDYTTILAGDSTVPKQLESVVRIGPDARFPEEVTSSLTFRVSQRGQEAYAQSLAEAIWLYNKAY